jgi:diguanylate cyclase (GGDEF)-like protein
MTHFAMEPSVESESAPMQTPRVLEPEALRILVVDDDPDSRDLVESAVRSLGYECVLASDGLEALEMHTRKQADVIISDWKMPRMDGLELCRSIRMEDPACSYTHFIFVTGNDDKSHFVEGMRAGADDYIAKPIDVDELEARLEAARRVVTFQRQLRENNTVLRRDSERAFIAARTDPLTTALNRLALTEDLVALAARAERYDHRYCAALYDIDQFKAYNDAFGHLAGDDALRRVAHTLHGELRRGDCFYRYGGEEFLAILPEQSLAQAASAMERARLAVEELAIPHAPKAARPLVTISIGIASMSASSTGSLDGWLRRADSALYVAKARGRNRVEIEGADLETVARGTNRERGAT